MTTVSGSSFATSFNPAQIASQMMSKGDQNGDAAMSFLEFMNLAETGSAETGSTETTSNATSSNKMESLFNAIDSNSDGSVTEGELTEFGQKISDAMTAVMLQAQQQCGQGGGESSQSGTNDPLDTNKDGTVSMMERLAARFGNQDGNQSVDDQIKALMAQSGYQNGNSTRIAALPPALSMSA